MSISYFLWGVALANVLGATVLLFLPERRA
jgi:hypothetical protein